MAEPDRPRPPDPRTRLLDVMVFAPIGLAAVARERLDALAADGRQRVEQRVTVARLVGKMAVEKGRRELQRRWQESVTDRASSSTSRRSADAGATGERAVRRTATIDASATAGVVDPAADPGADPAAVASNVPDDPVSIDDLPIDDYESLAASHVVARLADLDDDGLDAVESFERSHRNRRTVLGRIEQLRSSA